MGECMTDYEHLEKLLDSKLDGFLTLLKIELSNVKKEVAEIADELSSHQNSNEDLEKMFRESLVRVHTRIDGIDDKIEALTRPKKLRPIEIMKLKAIEWTVPFGLGFILWIVASGSFLEFLKKVTGN